MKNLIIILILMCIVGGAFLYIYKAKKKGTACIGCPYAKNCQGHKCGGNCLEKEE